MGNPPLAPSFDTLQARGMQGFQDQQAKQNAALVDGSLPPGAPRIPNTVLPNPAWEGFLQALQDQGVDQLGTAAAKGIGAPGFFDVQNPNNLQQQGLLTELRNQDAMAGRPSSVPSAAAAWQAGITPSVQPRVRRHA